MRNGRLCAFLAVAILLGAQKSSEAQISGVAVTLAWTAPGDDSLTGRAHLYDVRYSRRPITEDNFSAAVRALPLRPQPPGTEERFTVVGLIPGVDYYFAVKTVDEAGNWSRISNLAVRPGRRIDTEMPVAELSGPWPNPARGQARFSLALPAPDRVRVEAFDPSGRRLRTLAAPAVRPAGKSDLVWDLADDHGRPVGAGVYLVRAQIGGTTHTRRVLVVR